MPAAPLIIIIFLLIASLFVLFPPIQAAPDMQSTAADEKIVIAHRGASGYLPEHTLPAYALAYGLGADYIEPDVVMTRDGVLIALHDITLQDTTNVEQVFPERARTEGEWFAADFTLEEIKRLSAQERLEGRFRQDSRGFQVPTLEEVIQMVQELNRLTGCKVGIYPEVKESSFHRNEGLHIEEALLELLQQHGYEGPKDRVFVQSFEPDSLKFMRSTLGTRLRLVQLISSDPVYDPLVTPQGLDEIATYANGIGPSKLRIEDEHGHSVNNNMLVRLAHARNLVVHPYTFRADQLTAAYASLKQELRRFYFHYGVDGLFIDQADIAVELLDGKTPRAWARERRFCD